MKGAKMADRTPIERKNFSISVSTKNLAETNSGDNLFESSYEELWLIDRRPKSILNKY